MWLQKLLGGTRLPLGLDHFCQLNWTHPRGGTLTADVKQQHTAATGQPDIVRN